MKQGRCMFVSLALLSLFCAPFFGQPSTKSVTTLELDNFDGTQEMDWTWDVQASRFVTEGYPKLGYFAGMPNSLRPLVAEGDPEPSVLGVKASFARKGDNWIEVFPVTADGAKYEVPFTGIVSQVDFWVWGTNYKYYLEMMVRDADGLVHVLPVGFLNFYGWKNVIVNIPGNIRQNSRLRTAPQYMTFVGFRITADPNEFVDDFVVYFDEIKYTTNILATMFDGYELKTVDFGDEGGDAAAAPAQNADAAN